MELRSVSLSIVGAINLFMTFMVAQAFLPILCAVKCGLFVVFAVMVFFMTAYVGFLAPEMREVPIEEMQRVQRALVLEIDAAAPSPAKLDINC